MQPKTNQKKLMLLICFSEQHELFYTLVLVES